MASPKYRLNKKPRLSANQLAELVNATPTRRKSIIRDAKFPKTVTVAHYSPARDAIEKFLTHAARTTPNFSEEIQSLSELANAPTATDWKRGDALLSAEALQRVESAYGNTGLGAMDMRSMTISSPKLTLEGVSVSIAPFASVHGKHKGADVVGCATLLFNKSEQSASARQHRCRSAAILSLMFSQKHLSGYGEARPKLCLVYDVFEGRVTPAPSNFKRALDNMRAQCEEVAARWATIEPPADYDGPTP